ncbi:MAG: FKBP-type peptidyl-prolyl cis-trans isomerase [Rickettsiales bacterium]|jgi:FKBP-type peptidyl-prolyl cis-trans isomerase|nr:FKBP-type peptidyl-prolyl cis-trans isomerase [Rickettsiales bacterium]
MRKRFITTLIIAFAIYAFMNSSKQLSIKTSIKEAPAYKFLEDAKYYLEVLSEDPPSTALQGKNKPIIETQPSTKTPERSTKTIRTRNNASSSAMFSTNRKQNQQISETNNKLSNILYNVMHTDKGQELLERVLFNPPIYEDRNKDQEPNPYHNNSSIDIIQGIGEQAECGDTITAHYIIRLVSGQEIENTYKSGKPTTFTLGERQVIKGLEHTVIGMKKEGIRRLIVPPKMAYQNEKRAKGLVAGNEFVTIDVEILNIQPVFKDWQNKIRIFENKNIKNRPILCGDTVYFNYTISNGNNKVIYKSSSPASFILGSSSIPPAINKSFSDIRRFSKRSVVLSSSLLYNQKISFLPKNIKLPNKEIIILDIEINN